jgi:HK97 family phage portal protein
MNIIKSITGLVKKLYYFTEDGGKIPINGNNSFASYFLGKENGYGYEERISEKLNINSFGSNPYFFMVIDRLASIGAGLPRAFIDTENGKEYTTPLRGKYSDLKMVFEEPNSHQDQYDFYYNLLVNLYLGDLYIFKEENTIAPSLYVITPSNVTINEDSNGISPKSYSFIYFGKQFTNVEPENVLHLKRINPICDTHYGLPTAVPSTSLWNISNQLFKNAWNLFKNSGIMGVLHGKGNSTVMTPNERNALQTQYNKEAGNSKHLGKVYVASTELGFLSMGMNPTDLKSVEQNLQLKRDICALLGTSSQLYGDIGASTYSNMEQAERAELTNAILPINKRIDKALNRFLNPRDKIKYKVNESQIPLLQDAKTELITNSINLYNSKLITLQEARERLGDDYKDVPIELLQNQIEQNNVTNENSNNQDTQQNE